MDLRHALGLNEPLIERVHRIFRIGTGKMRHCRFGFDLRLHQRLDPLPDAIEAHFKGVRRLALPYQRFPQPDRGWNQYQRNDDNDDPCKLGKKRLRRKCVHDYARFVPFRQD